MYKTLFHIFIILAIIILFVLCLRKNENFEQDGYSNCKLEKYKKSPKEKGCNNDYIKVNVGQYRKDKWRDSWRTYKCSNKFPTSKNDASIKRTLCKKPIVTTTPPSIPCNEPSALESCAFISVEPCCNKVLLFIFKMD